jgi:putative DNA modification/repair radical SAM protein
MDIMQKLSILGEAARYDVSCSSSGSNGLAGTNKDYFRRVGNTAPSGICHTWTTDGRCISLLKVLLTNVCEYSCAYCINRKENNISRAAFTPRELAVLTIEFYRRNYIEGLFLSSGVVKNPDHTMTLLIETVSILRNEFFFGGYVHVKAIPGASEACVEQLGTLSDRMSVNLEFCTDRSMSLLAPQKQFQEILRPMNYINRKRLENEDSRKSHLHPPPFVPGGQSTQLIIGADPASDHSILSLSQNLYKKLHLKRVYYSAYIPLNTHQNLPAVTSSPPLLREHRLYQADWLLRFYQFDASELLSVKFPNLDLRLDPKCSWAIRHFNRFPVEINRADYETLLRVPGVGILSAKRILAARRYKALSYDNAIKLGIVMKRAVFFLTFNGKYHADASMRIEDIFFSLTDQRGRMLCSSNMNHTQIKMEDLYGIPL